MQGADDFDQIWGADESGGVGAARQGGMAQIVRVRRWPSAWKCAENRVKMAAHHHNAKSYLPYKYWHVAAFGVKCQNSKIPKCQNSLRHTADFEANFPLLQSCTQWCLANMYNIQTGYNFHWPGPFSISHSHTDLRARQLNYD